MKKRVAMLCIFLAICCGCHAVPEELSEPIGESVITEQEVPANQIVIAIDLHSEQIIEDAAEEMAKMMFVEGLQAELMKAADPALLLSAGNAQVAFLDGRRYGGSHAFFSLMAEPFRYRNYLHFTTSLNSEMVLQYLRENMEESHNQTPLAAYYQGSSLLLSDSALAAVPGLLEDNEEEQAEDENRDFSVLIRSDSLLTGPLELAGASVSETADTLRKINLVLEREASLAEFSAWELGEELLDVNDEEAISVYRAYHDAVPLWLIADTGFYGGLSQRQQAELQEACAMLFSKIDDTYLEQEQKAYENLTDFGFAEGGSHLAFRSFIREVTAVDSAPLTAEEKHLAELLEQVE